MTEQPNTAVELHHAAAMPAPQGGALPTGLEWQALERMAQTLATSNLVPYRLKGKPGDVAVILLAAREYGIPPLMALTKLPVINGTPAPMGELMVALILRAGHYIAADFRNPDGTVYAGGPVTPQHYGEARYKRRDWPEREVMRFTLEEALTAGLIDRIDQHGRAVATVEKTRNGNTYTEPTPWQQYTPNMARWRAVANAARLNFPDVLLGLSYLPEELGATVDEDGAPVDGEIVAQRGGAVSRTLEERTAQEAADRLAEFSGPVEVLNNVTAHAEANGYLDARVTYADGPHTLRTAIEAKRLELEAIVDVDSTEEEEAAEAPQEAASAPQEPEEPAVDAQPAPAEESPQDAALDVAREALRCNDAEVLRTYWHGAHAEGLLTLDVIAVVSDADLATLKAPPGLTELPLGSLLLEAGKYVAASGVAVSDPAPERAFDGPAQVEDVEDPWADGSGTAAGPTRDDLEQAAAADNG